MDTDLQNAFDAFWAQRLHLLEACTHEVLNDLRTSLGAESAQILFRADQWEYPGLFPYSGSAVVDGQEVILTGDEILVRIVAARSDLHNNLNDLDADDEDAEDELYALVEEADGLWRNAEDPVWEFLHEALPSHAHKGFVMLADPEVSVDA